MPQKNPMQKCASEEKIAFLVPKRGRPFEGCIRPFVNWAKELSLQGQDIVFILHKWDRKHAEEFAGIADAEIMESASDAEMRKNLESAAPAIMIADDSIASLRTLEGIDKRAGIPTVIYAQVLFASHSIAEVFHTEELGLQDRLVLDASRLIPFSLLKRSYIRSLRQHGDIIIANSNTTAGFMQIMYGLEPDGVVYPPVDRNVFKPLMVAKREQVLVYLGSHDGDTDAALTREICQTLAKSKMDTLIFGNRDLAAKLKGYGFALKDIGNATDAELATAYAQSLLTVCPQKWEPFGYVAAESISCGTQPLAFNCMGNAESVRMSGCGFLADRTDDMLDILERLDGEITQGTQKPYCGKGPFGFDSRVSTDALMKLIDERLKVPKNRR